MSYMVFLPDELKQLQKRLEFITWLRSLQIPFMARMRIYFEWLDQHNAAYTADEIDSLKTKEKVDEQISPE